MAGNLANEAIQIADKELGQFAFNKAVELRKWIISWAGGKEGAGSEEVVNAADLERVFKPDDKFNILKAVDEFTAIIMGDLEKFGDQAIQNLKTGWLAENPDSYWVTNIFKKGVVLAAGAGTSLGLEFVAGIIEKKLREPFYEAKKKLESKVQLLIQDIRKGVEGAAAEGIQDIVQEFKAMTFEEAATYVLKHRTQKLIHDGAVLAIHKNLGLPMDEAEKMLLDKKKAPLLLKAAIDTSAFAGQFAYTMFVPYDFENEEPKEWSWTSYLGLGWLAT